MKTERDIDAAVTALCNRLPEKGLSDLQKVSLSGMITALAWVLEHPGQNAVDDIMSGRELGIGQDHSRVMERFSRVMDRMRRD